MPPLQSHRQLIDELVRWTSANEAYATDMAIFVDHVDAPANSRPPMIGTSIPDLFGSNAEKAKALIGEAKTKNDIENEHCRRQLTDFLNFLQHWEDGHLVIAVPWQCTAQMRSLVRLLQKKTGTQEVRVTILDKLPC